MLRITITDLDNGTEMLNQTTDCIFASISSPEDDSTIQIVHARHCNGRTLLAGLAALGKISDKVSKKVSKKLFGEV